jgi:hypothetical protein
VKERERDRFRFRMTIYEQTDHMSADPCCTVPTGLHVNDATGWGFKTLDMVDRYEEWGENGASEGPGTFCDPYLLYIIHYPPRWYCVYGVVLDCAWSPCPCPRPCPCPCPCPSLYLYVLFIIGTSTSDHNSTSLRPTLHSLPTWMILRILRILLQSN